MEQEAQRATYRAPEYNVPPFWGIGQDRHFRLLISPKNTNLVEGIEILLLVKFRWIPFSSFRGEVENMSQLIRGQGSHLVFPIGPKHKNWVEDVEILLLVKFRWIPFSSFRGEVENVSANQRPGRPSCFSDRPEKHKLGTGRWDLASCQVSLNSVQRFQRSRKCLSQSEARAAILSFRSAWKTQTWYRTLRSCFLSSFVEFRLVSEEKLKISQPIRGQGGHLVFPIGPKNTNLVEDVEIVLPVKFRWIPFSGFRGEVENVSANQRPGRPSCFSDRPEKHKLGRGRWDLASCQVSLNSVQRFLRRSWKCEKLMTDGQTDGRTDDGQRVITIVHLSLRLRCTNKKLPKFQQDINPTKA